MMAITRVILLIALCLCVSAVQHSHRHFEAFSPAVPQAHIVNIVGGRVGFLSTYQPRITSDDSHAIALDLAEQILGFPAKYIVSSSYVTKHNTVRHTYLRQVADDGRQIFNADLNINVLNGVAMSLGHTFYNGSTEAVIGAINSLDALTKLAEFLSIDVDSADFVATSLTGHEHIHTISGVKGSEKPANVRSGYLAMDYGTRLEPVWDIELDMGLHWWSARVSSLTGTVLAVNDWVADASFNVYPIGVNDPSDGERTVVLNPSTQVPSPNAWNEINGTLKYTTSAGNNVYAQSNPTGSTTGNWMNNPRADGTALLNFIFSINFADAPASYANASITNLFFWNNIIHDLFYNYGFTETAGNFQENNFGRGGLQNDAVQANCQDGAGTNNANFATPVDGQRPKMRMYVWTASTPYRDGDLDQGIIIHEYLHGISNRLTGGPNNVNCLGSGQAGGMGEGWGDFFATLIRQRSTYTRNKLFPMGDYSANKPGGIRIYPYTSNMTANPETFAFINGAAYSGVHAKGEVWCGILWEVYWNLIDVYGFAPDLYEGNGGNTKMFQIVIDGMKLQPCTPNFVQARDAILLAFATKYGGEDNCPLWRGFAKRGLGVGAVATGTVKEDFTVPTNC